MGDETLRQLQTGPLAPYLPQVQRAETVVIDEEKLTFYELLDEFQ